MKDRELLALMAAILYANPSVLISAADTVILAANLLAEVDKFYERTDDDAEKKQS